MPDEQVVTKPAGSGPLYTRAVYRAPSPVTACPRCRRALEERKTDYESIVVLACPSCGGVWLDVEQATAVFKRRRLERPLVKVSESAARGAQAPAAASDGIALCPIGGEEMMLCEAEGIRIDQCAEHGTWFDAHEIRRIVDSADRPSALRTFLTRVLWGKLPGFND